MKFNSPEFAIFFVCVCCLYYAARSGRSQLAILILASLIFYSWSNPALLLLLLFCIVMNGSLSWALGLVGGKRNRLLLAGVGITINLVLLCSFKYALLLAFAADKLFHLNLAAIPGYATLFSLPLPIGISFYTFEAISLLVDSLRNSKQGKLTEHIYKTAAFISFFPHLIAGPIIRAGQFWPQIERKYLKDVQWDHCFTQLIVGYFLKVVIADDLASVTQYGFLYSRFLSSFELLLVMVGFSVRIFSDFAGYSYIAIGLAGLLGYRLPINFNWPYCSQSLSEFWRRWHITLSQWLRDYLYIPLGGSKCGNVRALANIMFVMFVGGLWHGAGTNFVIWGGLHGVGLCVERILGGRQPATSLLVKAFRTACIFTFVSSAWIFFAQPKSSAILFYQHLLQNWALPMFDPIKVCAIVLLCMPVLLWHVIVWLREQNVPFLSPAFHASGWSRQFAYAVMIFLTVANPGYPNNFIYFQF